jgi:hypothetical protein
MRNQVKTWSHKVNQRFGNENVLAMIIKKNRLGFEKKKKLISLRSLLANGSKLSR